MPRSLCVDPTLITAATQAIRDVGLPAVVCLILLYLLKRQQDSATKQNEILSALTEHVFEGSERQISNSQKLEDIKGILNRGVCNITRQDQRG
jgi:hypothetical protein